MAIAAGDNALVRASIDAAPALATARIARRDEFFIAYFTPGSTKAPPPCTPRRSHTTVRQLKISCRGAPTSAPATAGVLNPCTQPSSVNLALRTGTRRVSGQSSTS
jgi:hypothetical protein